MRPAFSVIFFTTASGAGYGLLFWLSLLLIDVNNLPPMGFINPAILASFTTLQTALPAGFFLSGFIFAILIVTLGLVSSTFHLGRPSRAWRAFSQIGSSWLSREGVLAVLAYIPALALFVQSSPLAGWIEQSGFDLSVLHLQSLYWPAAMVVLSLATVFATAMIYATLRPIPAWAHPLTVPQYLLYALFGGLVLALGLMIVFGLPVFELPYLKPGIFGLIGLMAGIKIIYWASLWKINRSPAFTPGHATGLGTIGQVRPLMPPHTAPNWIMKEMIFIQARHKAVLLKCLVLLLAFVAPALLVWGQDRIPDGPLMIGFAVLLSISVLIGTGFDRTLFFAEARHIVRSYYRGS